MEIRIVREPLPLKDIADTAGRQFGDMVKAVVDVGRGLLALGGELHADAEAALLDDGSRQSDLWGINLYPKNAPGEFVEFDSMINIRPSQGNRSRGVDDPARRRAVLEVVGKLILP
ncbi:MAG TPA: hypothetical protein DD417_02930 [Elusimicrobia bacterium]|nr:hypothetical protein [Elusimicrobiota bacterium]